MIGDNQDLKSEFYDYIKPNIKFDGVYCKFCQYLKWSERSAYCQLFSFRLIITTEGNGAQRIAPCVKYFKT